MCQSVWMCVSVRVHACKSGKQVCECMHVCDECMHVCVCVCVCVFV